MDDLEPVAIMQDGFVPAIPRHDVAVEFHGDAIGFHPEHIHESREGNWRDNVAEVPLFSIDLQFHG